MLLNLYPTPIHKSAITNSLSRVLRAGVLISSQLFVRTVVGPQHSTGQLQFQQQLIQSYVHHPLRDTADTLQILENCANVWAGRFGSSPGGLDPQMARCRQHKKTVS